MLLEFAVSNYRSYGKEVLFSMVPGKRDRIHGNHVIRSDQKGKKVSALPLALLYGANASGKSNLVKAMSCARRIIVEGSRGASPIRVVPYRLDDESAERPSRFEFVLKHNDIVYTYGFTATQHRIVDEWLFAYYTARESLLFERVTVDNKAVVSFGNRLASSAGLRDRLGFVAAGTRPNQLFLTEAIDRNVEELQPLMNWFKDHLKIVSPSERYHLLPLRLQQDERFARYLNRFMTAADTGIDEIIVEERNLEADQPITGVPDFFRKEVLSNISDGTAAIFGAGASIYSVSQQDDQSIRLLTLQTKHSTRSGAEVRFDLEDESDGTNRLMDLAPALLRLERSEDVYVIDELDRSLHPNLCRSYVEAFLAGVSKRGCRGQMILTTHNAGLLDLDLVRRDEVWLVEKDSHGSSLLHSLADFRIRADLRIDKGYVDGRFGAVPYLGDIAGIFHSERRE